MLKSKYTPTVKNSAWSDHNKRVAKVEAQARELEALFPHKFKHPKIGRYYMMDRENGLRLPGMRISPAVEIYQRPRDPSWYCQVILAILMVSVFVGACYVF